MNKLKISIHQPNFLPRLKTLYKIYNCNIFVVLDNVQYERNEWQNRTQLRNLKNYDQCYWLTLPIKKLVSRNTNINRVECSDIKVDKILKSIRLTYSSSPYYDSIFKFIKNIFIDQKKYLCDYTSKSMIDFLKIINPELKIYFASDIVEESKFKCLERNEKLIYLCKKLNCETYYCGTGGGNYLNDVYFRNNKIDVIHQNWNSDEVSDKYDKLNWDSVSFIDFWARYGMNELKTFLNS